MSRVVDKNYFNVKTIDMCMQRLSFLLRSKTNLFIYLFLLDNMPFQYQLIPFKEMSGKKLFLSHKNLFLDSLNWSFLIYKNK
jgi:hypothetical protein